MFLGNTEKFTKKDINIETCWLISLLAFYCKTLGIFLILIQPMFSFGLYYLNLDIFSFVRYINIPSSFIFFSRVIWVNCLFAEAFKSGIICSAFVVCMILKHNIALENIKMLNKHFFDLESNAKYNFFLRIRCLNIYKLIQVWWKVFNTDFCLFLSPAMFLGLATQNVTCGIIVLKLYGKIHNILYSAIAIAGIFLFSLIIFMIPQITNIDLSSTSLLNHFSEGIKTKYEVKVYKSLKRFAIKIEPFGWATRGFSKIYIRCVIDWFLNILLLI